MRHKSFSRLCQFLSTTYQESFIKKTKSLTLILKTTRLPDVPTSRKNDGNNKVIKFDISDNSSDKASHY